MLWICWFCCFDCLILLCVYETLRWSTFVTVNCPAFHCVIVPNLMYTVTVCVCVCFCTRRAFVLSFFFLRFLSIDLILFGRFAIDYTTNHRSSTWCFSLFCCCCILIEICTITSSAHFLNYCHRESTLLSHLLAADTAQLNRKFAKWKYKIKEKPSKTKEKHTKSFTEWQIGLHFPICEYRMCGEMFTICSGYTTSRGEKTSK